MSTRNSAATDDYHEKSLEKLGLHLPDRCDGDGLYVGGRLVLSARDAQGMRALASLRCALADARGDADKQLRIIRRGLPYFLVANRDHLCCLCNSPGFFGDVAALASRPGAIAAFTRGSLKVLAEAPPAGALPTATTRLIEWARSQGIEVVRPGHAVSPTVPRHEIPRQVLSA